MLEEQQPPAERPLKKAIDPGHKVLLAFGLFAPAVTFGIAVSELSMNAKTAVLAAIGLVYAAICVWAFRRAKRGDEAESARSPIAAASEADSDVEEKLLALEEANTFFGTSLKSADMFRLVASRVNELFPFAAAVLMSPDDESGRLMAKHAVGNNAAELEEPSGEPRSGLAELAMLSREIEFDHDLGTEREARPAEQLAGFRSSVAIPLFHETEVFAVFQVFTPEPIEKDKSISDLLHAVGNRIAPLFLSSRTFERTITNALTDPLTNLPNERALFMVLENQLAESQRFRDERPLSVLAIDLKGFDEANRRYGHATGDNILRHAGETIRDALRKMDFLARATNDEFIIVLPTASESTAKDVVQRLGEVFTESPFEISDHEEIKLWLNIGSATFWKDGESAQQLLNAARLRKQQAKSEQPGNVLWFSKEYVN